LHGANRLGGNSLSDLIVFGKLAGDGATAYVKSLSGRPEPQAEQVEAGIRQATAVLNRESGKNPYLVHEDLQEVMGKYVGIVRTEDELQKGLSEIERLKADIKQVKAPGASQYNPGWHEALDLSSLSAVAEAVTRSALLRKESRGAHTRLDYEDERDEGLTYNVVIRKTQSGMDARKEPRPEPDPELKRIAHATIEALDAEVARENQST
jgi:succinate dehydrogenase / fumarate reductase flavoprotein subunit